MSIFSDLPKMTEFFNDVFNLVKELPVCSVVLCIIFVQNQAFWIILRKPTKKATGKSAAIVLHKIL